jgi:hypothetical protein
MLLRLGTFSLRPRVAQADMTVVGKVSQLAGLGGELTCRSMIRSLYRFQCSIVTHIIILSHSFCI